MTLKLICTLVHACKRKMRRLFSEVVMVERADRLQQTLTTSVFQFRLFLLKHPYPHWLLEMFTYLFYSFTTTTIGSVERISESQLHNSNYDIHLCNTHSLLTTPVSVRPAICPSSAFQEVNRRCFFADSLRLWFFPQCRKGQSDCEIQDWWHANDLCRSWSRDEPRCHLRSTLSLRNRSLSKLSSIGRLHTRLRLCRTRRILSIHTKTSEITRYPSSRSVCLSVLCSPASLLIELCLVWRFPPNLRVWRSSNHAVLKSTSNIIWICIIVLSK